MHLLCGEIVIVEEPVVSLLRPAVWIASDPDGTAGAFPALGIILGCAVNANGRASSLTAPHGPSQQALLRAVGNASGVRPSDVDGLQMHSNGTSLGDPIEVGAMAAVMLVSSRL